MTTYAAIYARKSTSQVGIDDEDKSVSRQIALARAFGAEKSWQVIEEYVDDGISGRETAKLVNRARMLADATSGKFSKVIVRDFDRISRDDREGPSFVYMLQDAGVEVFEYATKSPIDTSTALKRTLLNMKAGFASHEAEASAARTYEQKKAKASRGPLADGQVFGYRNVGEPKHRRREIHPDEAPVVRRIFELYAGGMGFARIAQTLGAENALAPKPRKPPWISGWSASSVREILHRPLYKGEVLWNQRKKRDPWGRKVYASRPECEWVRIQALELRIISDELWKSAHARLNRVRQIYLRATNGRLHGKPATGVDSKYLLSGLLQCGECGAALVVVSKGLTRGRRKYAYACSTSRFKGKAKCSNGIWLDMEDWDRYVIQTVDEMLDPVKLRQAVEAVLAEIQPAEEEAARRRAKLQADLGEVEEGLENLTTAIARGGGCRPSSKPSVSARRSALTSDASSPHSTAPGSRRRPSRASTATSRGTSPRSRRQSTATRRSRGRRSSRSSMRGWSSLRSATVPESGTSWRAAPLLRAFSTTCAVLPKW